MQIIDDGKRKVNNGADKLVKLFDFGNLNGCSMLFAETFFIGRILLNIERTTGRRKGACQNRVFILF